VYIYEIKFPGDEEFTDISNLVRYESVNASYRLFNDGMKSVVDTFSFRIKYEQTIYQKFDLASDKIICKVAEGSTPVFTGYVGPEVSNQLGEVPEDLTLTAQDNSWLLDDAVKASFEYPLTIGATPFFILSFSAPGNSIVHHLLEAAGYAVPDVFAPDCPEITSRVQHISGAADQGTYRQILDDLLMEYGHVFRFTESGHFTVVKWDKDSIAAEDTLEGNFCVNQKLSVKKGYWPYDGIKLYWNELDTMQGALLYRENLPLSVQEGTIGFTGKDIAPEDYYPKDGDIKEVFQEFRTDWLDLAYLQRDSRLENQDLSLVSSEEHIVQFDADVGVVKSSELFEQKRAKLLLQNTSGEIKKLYRLEIYGTALFRSSVQKVTVPSSAVKPAEVEAKYIFESNQAQRFATAMKRMRQFGIRIFSFTVPRDHKEFSLGQVLHIGQADPIIDTNVLVQDKQFNDVTNLVKYVCVGITGYSPETISSTSTTPGILPAQSEKAAEANVVSLIDNGYSSASSTGNPSQLIPQSKSGVRSIAILWPAQVTLRWIDHYEIQVSEDYDPQNPGDANWYAPSSDGIDWKGALNESVSIYDTMFIHENIPAAGTEADPQNRTLYYRVRQVTRAGVTGDWSTVVNGTTNLIGAGDILAGSVLADKIDTLGLFALDILLGGQIRSAAFTPEGAPVGTQAGFWLSHTGKLKAMFAELIGTLRTGIGAALDARVAIQDEAGITDGPNFTGTGADDLVILESGFVSGEFEVEITGAAALYEVGDIGPAGGRIFYIDSTTSPPTCYEAWTADEPSTYQYRVPPPSPTYGTGTAIGTGSANTYNILNTSTFPAGQRAASRTYGGYTDWFLPSRDELLQLWARRANVGGFTSDYYWSSSAGGYDGAQYVLFFDGYSDDTNAYNAYRVRVVRSFPQQYGTFRWRNVSGSWSANVEINGSTLPVALNDGTDYGISLTFSSYEGHDVGDLWSFTQEGMRGLSVKDSDGNEYFSCAGGKVTARALAVSDGAVYGEESVGTLHILKESNRPSGYLSSGTRTGATKYLIDTSAYIPFGAKAALITVMSNSTGAGISVVDPDEEYTGSQYSNHLSHWCYEGAYQSNSMIAKLNGAGRFAIYPSTTIPVWITLEGYYI